MWDMIVSVPDHCLSFYFKMFVEQNRITEFENNVWSLSVTEQSEGPMDIVASNFRYAKFIYVCPEMW